MKVNAGWSRKIKKDGETYVENVNTTNLEIDVIDIDNCVGSSALRQAIMAHMPEGEGWRLCGYSIES